MILSQRIVLVIGAGCSASYRFPTGRALVEEVIAGATGGSGDLFDTLLACGHPLQEVTDFGTRLRAARPKSIDRFIQANPSFAIIGKRAIAAVLMPKEVPSSLRQTDIAYAGLDWLDYLQSEILHAPKFEDVRKNLVSFVTFNFDRVIEFSLFNWLVTMYGATSAEAAEAVKGFGVIHVNGQLGSCPWLGDSQNSPRHFQPDRGATVVAPVAAGLHIIGDEIGDEPRAAVTELLLRAQQVYFLGFSFDALNLAWLQSCGLNRNGLERFGTHLGMTHAEARGAREAAIAFPDGFPAGPEGWDAKTLLSRADALHESLGPRQ